MAVNLYSATPPYGLFNILGKLFKAETDINTSRGTTIPTDVLNAITEFNTITPVSNLTQIFNTVPTAISQYQSGPVGCLSVLSLAAQNLLIGMVQNDSNQPNTSLSNALTYIINQMIATSASINVSAVTITPTAGGSNVGNGALVFSTKQGAGLAQENMLGETLGGTFSNSGLTASLSLVGQQAASGLLEQDWPLGSGSTSTLTSVDANSSSILSNGGFETFNTQVNVPDSWTATVATPGTTLLQTILEIQQIVIAGTPTGGSYILSWANPAGKTLYSTPIQWNGSASSIQSALRTIAGLGSVVVALTSGTSPNITVAVTYNGQGGNVSQLNFISSLTGGSPTITISTLTGGTTQVFAGSYALEFLSNGSELTAIQQLIPQSSLTPLTAYGVSLWACCGASIAAGVVKIDLWDGSAIINDAQGNANAITFNATALTTSFQHLSALQAAECAFRMPANLPPAVYIRIHITTTLTNTKAMYVDQVGLTPMTQIYPGGPLLALFSGNTPWGTADTWSVATTNNRAGVVREDCQRNFNMASLGLLFPTSGSATIPDSVAS